MVSVDCLLERIWDHIGDKSLDTPVMGLLDRVDFWLCLWVISLISLIEM